MRIIPPKVSTTLPSLSDARSAGLPSTGSLSPADAALELPSPRTRRTPLFPRAPRTQCRDVVCALEVQRWWGLSTRGTPDVKREITIDQAERGNGLVCEKHLCLILFCLSHYTTGEADFGIHLWVRRGSEKRWTPSPQTLLPGRAGRRGGDGPPRGPSVTGF